MINKLYDESSPSAVGSSHCNGSCKCDIEIMPVTRLITIKDCSCKPSLTNIIGDDATNNNNNKLYDDGKRRVKTSTVVENPSYFDEPVCWPTMKLNIDQDDESSTTPDLIKTSTALSKKKSDEFDDDDDDNNMEISSNDLLLFALQIANGMVIIFCT